MAAPAQSTYTRQTGTNTATSTFNGTTVDARTKFSARFFGSITNGATPPTIPGRIELQASQDNFSTDVNTVKTVTGSLTASAVTTFDFERPFPGGYLRVRITGNTGQSITYIISGNTVDTIA